MKTIEVDEKFIKDMNKHRKPDKSLGLIGACSKNVVVFAERMLGLRLYAWQVYFLEKTQKAMEVRGVQTKEYLAMTSRQIGKSTAVAILALWACVFNKYPGTVSTHTIFGITSASDVQAKKLLYEIKKFIRLGDGYMKRTYKEDNKPMFGESFFTDLLDEHEPNNTTTVTFKAYNEEVHGEYLLLSSLAGSVIKSYPPTSSVLGETFTVVVIDEAGKTDKISDQFFYDYIYPTGNSTNAVRIYLSTPWVSSGFFYRLVDPDSSFGSSSTDLSVFTVDAIKLEAPEYYQTVMNTVEQLNKDGKKDEVQRAYYCRFVKGEQSYFNPDKVFDAFTHEHDMVFSYNGFCDMGVDFGGKVNSKTVITISELTPEGKVRRLYHKAYEVDNDETLIDDMEDLMKHFNVQRVIPDDCPAGHYLIKEMEAKGWDVQPMNFRSDKVKKYGAFRSMLNNGKIESYKDEALQTEMLAMEYTHHSRQSIIAHAPGYTDDLIDSFVMSAYFYLVEEGGFKVFNWEESEEEESNCPACNSHRIEYNETKRICMECKYEWAI